MRRLIFVFCAIALAGPAIAASCPGRPNALGVSRVMAVDPKEYPRVGRVDYDRTLPLAPGEVVLTFDDGPNPPTTTRVLQALSDECVKAVFFMVGRNAKAHPEMARQVAAAGHTVGTHTQNHPLRPMSPERARREIDAGIASVGAALGSPDKVAPFFRFPGLYHTRAAENYLNSRGIASWSIDVESDDWRRINGNEVLRRIMTRLAAKGRGIVLMHDIHTKTANLVPTLLERLKERGYRVVQVVPAGGRTLPPGEIMAQKAAENVTKPAEIPRQRAANDAVARVVTNPAPSTELIYAGPSYIVLERPERAAPPPRRIAQPPIERIYMPRAPYR